VDLGARWQAASERAKLANVVVTPIDSVGTYQVTSASHPGVADATDGLNCTCQAAQFGEEVCLHRAAVRDYHAARVRCSICGGCGWEHVSIWDWHTGQAMDLYSIRCSCQTDPEPEPRAPAAGTLERGLADAYDELDRNHAVLHRYQSELDRTGRLKDRDWQAFDRAGDANKAIHDRIRTLKAQLSAQNVECAP
jgi:hypothetical protein